MKAPGIASAQRGAVLLLLLLLVGTLALTLLVRALNRISPDEIKRRKSAEALQQARSALLAWSIARGDDASSSSAGSPGELPCPDTSPPGSASEGLEAASCAAGALGRLPWRTLGIARLVDGYGEPLWYAVDGGFKRRTSSEIRLVNSDTRASLQVYAGGGIQLQTPAGEEAAAVIFAPGPALPAQDRVAGVTAAANYLDATGGRNNATAGGPFIAADAATDFNDQLIVLSGSDLLDAIVPRLAAAVRQAISAYRNSANNPDHVPYPRPALISDSKCRDNDPGIVTTGSSICRSQSNVCRGILPQVDAPPGGSDIVLAYPVWFKQNLWYRAVYFAVASDGAATGNGNGNGNGNGKPSHCTDGHGNDINTPGCNGKPVYSDCGTITVTGLSDNPDALVIFPGSPRGSIVRIATPQSKNLLVSTSLGDYLEDSANQDGWSNSTPAADVYQLPGIWQTRWRCSQRGAANNDRLCTLALGDPP
ncbi:hypothetical protein [Chitinilyticum piscinae]|uniref:Uncharacterized protein n=1 Tax=Chitinilyticum piscinae TaxID=2866724 RepID=A0A8J7FEV9_9NEIS|nr:hypothetical protein [Chitinilyticum piscinae]MBE9607750.1 hypothetical protein [Chitinilyticum piscinae]